MELWTFLVGAAYISTADISRDFPDPRTSTSVEPSLLDSECIYNQRCYGTMEMTGRFSASNWYISCLPRSADCSGKWLEGEQQKKSGSSKMGPDFANSATTGGRMDKRSWQADSGCKLGLDSIFQEVLTVVESGWRGNNKKTRDHQKWGPTLPIALQPEVVWTNGVDRRIQNAKLV